ncbi:hypothetical protein Taro_011243, partial [Colocasia esculenta]|nr:hypothetical protein [Colocasia esculenta]
TVASPLTIVIPLRRGRVSRQQPYRNRKTLHHSDPYRDRARHRDKVVFDRADASSSVTIEADPWDAPSQGCPQATNTATRGKGALRNYKCYLQTIWGSQSTRIKKGSSNPYLKRRNEPIRVIHVRLATFSSLHTSFTMPRHHKRPSSSPETHKLEGGRRITAGGGGEETGRSKRGEGVYGQGLKPSAPKLRQGDVSC